MAKSADSTNTFVLEYQGESESTKAAFNHLITALAEDSPEIEGFRLELTTANQFAGPFDMLVSQEATQEEIERPAEKSGTDEERDATSDEDSTSVPSLRSDALPSQVLSVMSTTTTRFDRVTSKRNSMTRRSIRHGSHRRSPA